VFIFAAAFGENIVKKYISKKVCREEKLILSLQPQTKIRLF